MLDKFIISLTILTPLYALMFWPLTFLKGKTMYYLTILLCLCFGVFFTLQPLTMAKTPYYFNIYFFVLAWYIFLFTNESYDLNFSLCTALLTLFVAADFWEIPVFIYGRLDLFSEYGYHLWVGGLLDHIHRFYVLAVFCLLLKIRELKFNWASVFYALLGLTFSFLFLSPLAYNPILARVTCLMLFGYAILGCLTHE